MAGPTGYWYIDGADLFSNYAVAIENGTALFLQNPERKESISHSWPSQHGIDIDTSRMIFKERFITLQCWMVTESETDFWAKKKAFDTVIAKPGQRRLSFTAFGGRSFYVIYQSMTAYRQVKTKTLKGIPDNMIFHQFNITFLEPNPQIESGEIFIAADDGNFLIV